MKAKLLSFFSLLLLGCSSGPDASIQMTSFQVLDQKSFKMCFTKDVAGIYALVIKMKSGEEIKKAGRLLGDGQQCFQELKMQHALSSYTSSQQRFYADSLVNKNIASVSWSISRRFYEEPLAEGEFLVK